LFLTLAEVICKKGGGEVIWAKSGKVTGVGGGGEGTTKSETVLLSSPNIIRVIKPRMRWAVHVACMGEMRVVYPQGSDAET